MHIHAGQHFLGLDGFGDVVDGTGFQRRHQVLGLGQTRHEDDGDVRRECAGLEAARHFKTINARHHGVQQHDVGQGLRGALQRSLARAGDQHGVAGFVQRVV